MTDNFDRYKELIRLCGGLPEDNKKGNLDKYYVIELMRRGKDNPDMPAANFHFKNYYIYSWRDLERYEDEIRKVCDLLRLRAYASVNYKLMSQVALDTLAESARRIAAHDYKKFYSIFESCSGKFTQRGNNIWVVDVDEMTDDDIMEIERMIERTPSKYEKRVLYHMPTKSGMHLICHPFGYEQFQAEYSRVFGGLTIDVKKNHITLLYENL